MTLFIALLALILNNRITSPEVPKSSSDYMYFSCQCGRKKQELSFRKNSLLAQKHKTANGLLSNDSQHSSKLPSGNCLYLLH